jgi:filamentous hemagglutinin family protein
MALRARALRLRTLLLAAVALPAAALAQTVITPDAGAALGLGTTAVKAGNVTTIDGGTLAGANLFHSFTEFSLAAGDTAQWVRAGGGASGVANVISRVTGGQASQIAGRIDSTALPNASFFFINPAGVIFAKGAQVNVPGAALFSTASELRFAGGAKFAVATPGGSTLSVAAPESFGFVGGQGNITLDGAGVAFANPLTSLSLTAANVGVTSSQTGLRGLDLIGVGNGAAVVPLADPLGAARTGAVSVSGSQLTVVPAGGAARPLRIGAGAINLDAGNLASFTDGAARGGDILLAARTINASGSLISTLATGDGPGGRLALTASDTISLASSTLGSNGTGKGTGGDIALTAARSVQIDTSNVVANAVGAGRGGAITASAPRLDLGAAVIYTTAAGAGSPGDVALQGDRISINGGSYGSAPGFSAGAGSLSINAATRLDVLGGFFSAVAYGDFTSGTIAITAPTMSFDSAFFDTESVGDGAVGVIDIQGRTISFDSSMISAVARGAAGARTGLVHIKATDSLLYYLGQINSTSAGRKDGGTVLLEGGRVTLDSTTVSADSNGDGKGGQVSLKADTLLISNSEVTSRSIVKGDAGDVSLEAGRITLDTGAEVSSETASLEGNAGKDTLVSHRGRTTINSQDGSPGDTVICDRGSKAMVFIDAGDTVRGSCTVAHRR